MSSCVPRKRSRGIEMDSDAESFDDIENSDDSGPGSDYDGVSTPDQDPEPISDVGAEFRQIIQMHKTSGPSKANHAPRTRMAIEGGKAYFYEFCAVVKANPETALRECEVQFIKGYLEWRVKYSRIKKESTIESYWKVHSMLYADSVSRKMDNGILYDIRHWFPTYLTPKYNLDDSEKTKSCVYIDELQVYIHCHWVRDTHVFPHERFRVQIPYLILCNGATTTRPGALHGVPYRNVELWLVRDKSRVPRLTMTLLLTNIKRSGGISRPVKHTFTEGADLPICIVLLLLSLAFADNAFDAELSTPKQIYDIVIPPRKAKIHIGWKEEWMDRPIVRDIEHNPNGIRISDTKPLDTDKCRKHFQLLGRLCGAQKLPEFYDLRRGGGKNITEAFTAEECNQIMGHRSRSTYQRYYMAEHVDQHVQAINFGMTEEKELVRLVGQRTRDVNAPKRFSDLNKAQRALVTDDATMLGFEKERVFCKEQIYALGFTKISDSEKKTEWYDKYITANAKFNARKALLRDKALNNAIAEYHRTADTIEINKQLRGIMPNDDDVLNPPDLQYELEDRAMAAKLLYQSLDKREASDIFQRRNDAIQCLARLSQVRESPRWYKPRKDASKLESDVPKKKPRLELKVIGHSLADLDLPKETLSCGFCWWSKKQIGPRAQHHEYPRIDNLEKHVKRWHFNCGADKIQECPYPHCTAVLGSSKTFMNHAERVHQLRVLGPRLRPLL